MPPQPRTTTFFKEPPGQSGWVSAPSLAYLNGNVNVGLGSLSLTYASGTPSFTNVSGTLIISNNTVFNVNNTGPALATASYKLVATNGAGGLVVAASVLPAPVVGGGGITNTGAASLLQILNGELYLVVSRATTIVQTALSASSITYGQALSNSIVSGTFTNAAGAIVPGSFAFVAPSAIPSARGST